MKVIDALKKEGPTLSFEFFPPKTEKGEEQLFDVIGKLKQFNPDFVSVTYGALGTTSDKSFFWVKEFKQHFEIEPNAHLTCVAATMHSMKEQLQQFAGIDVKNILALRGDPPQGDTEFSPPENGFKHASELVAFIKRHEPGFCVGVAGYPEKHIESSSIEEDIKHLKEKVDAGAEYIVTQLFFDNRHFFAFRDRCREAGINVPIVPGLMPITSLQQIKKMTDICGASIPQELWGNLEKHQNDPEKVKKIGVDWTVKQCNELLADGVPGLHFFVLNQAGPISAILDGLKLDRR